ncbi:MarR family winged helix-turn-helix transcriptional regulator [Demequina sediminicola]|uniref:MarR family winged helix-turn-helix transcriptional regulator n=1 Tax=Demequina sediminicola TaxID=1095026 RepID=UPI000785F39D|nr:MarR family transcriptional regulator [Demequina sediminicola]
MARADSIAEVLESLVWWQRRLASLPGRPFDGISLTRSQIDLLFALAHGPTDVTPGRLATHIGVTRGAITQTIEPLAREELVELAPHPTDARSKVVRLTERARGIVRDFEADAQAALAPHFSRLDDEELDHLAHTLTRTTEEQR